MYEFGTLKPVGVISRRARGERESNRGKEPNQGTFGYSGYMSGT
jgi:hypothetical protein